MRKIFITLLLGTLLSIYTWAIAPMPVMAATPTPQPAKLSTAIDHFMTSIPSDYYMIANVNALKDIVKKDNTLLIDVREPTEYAAGHIPSAINIPLRTLTQNLARIPTDRSVVLYCTAGYRTAMGVMALQILGYTNVRAFPPSIQGWKAAGEPLQK